MVGNRCDSDSWHVSFIDFFFNLDTLLTSGLRRNTTPTVCCQLQRVSNDSASLQTVRFNRFTVLADFCLLIVWLCTLSYRVRTIKLLFCKYVRTFDGFRSQIVLRVL